jgi:valyl-tRNA synthetase
MSEDGNMRFLEELIDSIRSMRIEAGLSPEEPVTVRFDGSYDAEQVIRAHKEMFSDLAGVDSMQFGSSPPDTQFHRSTSTFDVGLTLVRQN